MNKTRKYVLITGAALVIVGGLLFGISFLLTGGDWDRYATLGQPISRLNYSVAAEQVTALEVDELDREIRLQAATGGEVTVSYCEQDGKGYAIELRDGVLRVEREGGRTGIWGISMGLRIESALIISIPADFGGDVKLQNSSGEIRLDGLELARLELRTSSGEIDGSNLRSDALSASSSSGELRFADLHVQAEAVFSTTSGAVELRNLRCGSGRASASSGELTMEDVECAGAWDFSTSSGGIMLENCAAASVTGKAGSGEIDFRSLDAADIRLESASGSISGSLAGRRADYSITSRTSSGDNNLANYETQAPRSLNVRTGSGDIEIHFQADR